MDLNTLNEINRNGGFVKKDEPETKQESKGGKKGAPKDNKSNK